MSEVNDTYSCNAVGLPGPGRIMLPDGTPVEGALQILQAAIDQGVARGREEGLREARAAVSKASREGRVATAFLLYKLDSLILGLPRRRQ